MTHFVIILHFARCNIKFFFMNPKNKPKQAFFNQVKGVVRSLDLDQAVIAQKIGMSQANVSKALNGGNEKALLKIIDLLAQEYNISNFDAHLAANPETELQQIKAELVEIKTTLLELKALIEKK
jgi:transcriptional regulator with XRE-family HTH domain